MNNVITKAYVFNVTMCRRDGATPPEQMEMAVEALVKIWNTHVPANHVRILTSSRFRECQALLTELPLEIVTLAVVAYSKSVWNREKRAWKRFENWCTPDTVATWYEKWCANEESRELREQRQNRMHATNSGKTPHDRGRGGSTGNNGQPLGEGDEPNDRAAMEAIISAMPADQRERLMAAARERLAANVRHIATFVRLEAVKIVRESFPKDAPKQPAGMKASK